MRKFLIFVLAVFVFASMSCGSVKGQIEVGSTSDDGPPIIGDVPDTSESTPADVDEDKSDDGVSEEDGKEETATGQYADVAYDGGQITTDSDDFYYQWYKYSRPAVVNKDGMFFYGVTNRYFPSRPTSKSTYSSLSGYATVDNTDKYTVTSYSKTGYATTLPSYSYEVQTFNYTLPYIELPSFNLQFPILGGGGIDIETQTYPLTGQWIAGRIDTAVDPDLQRVLVAFERVEQTAKGPRYRIYARFYDKDGNKIGVDKLISEPPDAENDIDPRFHDVPTFANLTEPKCDDYRNPTVVFVRGKGNSPTEIRSNSRYIIAYEAHCEGTVNWPNDNQFFNNPQPANPIFDLEEVTQRSQKFSVIQAIKLHAADLHKLADNENPGPFYKHRMMGRLFAWFLNNDDGNNGGVLLKDNSIWKWSSAKSPHLSINKDGVVLLTYQTNLKFTTCLSNRMELSDDDQWGRYDRMFSIEGQFIYTDRRGKAFSLFRSGLTAPDGEEANPEPDMCLNYESTPDIESAYNPASAANDGVMYSAIFSVEKGSVDQHYAEDPSLPIPKSVSGNLVSINPQNNNERVPFAPGEETTYEINYSIRSTDMSGALVMPDDVEHSDPDIVYDGYDKRFLVAYDDGAGVHAELLDNQGQQIASDDPGRMIRGVNWADPIAPGAFRPMISDGLQDDLGGNVITKMGLSYHYKSTSANKWMVGQNYARLFINSAGKLELSFEKGSQNHYILSSMIPDVELKNSYGPSPTAMSWGERQGRFRTFWSGESQNNAEDTIYSVYVPEGMNPVALFDTLGDGVSWSSDSEGEERVIRLNNISIDSPLRLTLDGSRSFDPDKLDNAPDRGIVNWHWSVTGTDFARDGKNANLEIVGAGDYTVNLTVRDADGLTSFASLAFVVELNEPPTVGDLKMSELVGANEIPLEGESPRVIRGQEVVLLADGTDDTTLPEELGFRWQILDPRGLSIGNPVPIEGTRKVKFTVELEGEYNISVWAIDGDGAESVTPVVKNLIAETMAISLFESTTGVAIDLAQQSIQGNPRPNDVYGEVVFRWATVQAGSVRLLRDDANGQFIDVPVAELPDWQAGVSMPASTDVMKVRLKRNTTFKLEISGRGVVVQSSPVAISFRDPVVTLNVAQRVGFNNVTRDGAVVLGWSTRNIKQVQLFAYEWEDYRDASEPDTNVDEPSRVYPAEGGAYLRLIQPQTFSDRMARKTTYVLRGTDLLNNVREARQVVAFDNPTITSFAAESSQIDFLQGTSHGEARLNWQTGNASEVVSLEGILPDGSRIQYRYRNDQGIENDSFPFPDANGRGSTSAIQETATEYVLTVRNPDGRTAPSNRVAVRFNDPGVTIHVPTSMDAQGGPLYHGRRGLVSWENGRNIPEMTLYLADANGNIIEAGGESRVQNASAGDWTITLPEVQNPGPAPVVYKIRADIVNPNGGALITRASDVFNVIRRPSPKIGSFGLTPSVIGRLEAVEGAIKARSRLNWQTSDTPDHPVESVSVKVGDEAWTPLDIDFAGLGKIGFYDIVVDVPVGGQVSSRQYLMRVRNVFGDTVTTGGGSLYNDENPPPANPTLSFAAPEIVGNWALAEVEAYKSGLIHITVESRTATQINVVYIYNGEESSIHTASVNSWNADGVALSNIEVSLDNEVIKVGDSQVRIDLIGPGGRFQSGLLNLRILPGVDVVSFMSPDVSEGERINLLPATVAGNPSPNDVYGEVHLMWETSRAQSIRLYKREWVSPDVEGDAGPVLVPAADLPDIGDGILPFNMAHPGTRVRVYKNTTFILEARRVEAGEEFKTSSELRIMFNPTSATLNIGESRIPFRGAERNGVAALSWSTNNIKELHLVAYEWDNSVTSPNYAAPHTKTLDPVEGYLQLNQPVQIADNINKKTTYILKSTDLYGHEIPVTDSNQKIVAFRLPEVTTFAANPSRVDFMEGTAGGTTTLSWTTQNASTVRLFVGEAEVGGSPFATAADGGGSNTVQFAAPTQYRIKAVNPDGEESEFRNVNVDFNPPSVEISAPVSSEEGLDRLYIGREVSVSWNNSRNVKEMTLFLTDEADNKIPGYTNLRAGIPAVTDPPRTWTFRLPEVVNPPFAGLNYKIRAEIVNPNGGDPVIVTKLFAVVRRPSPRIDAFNFVPAEVEDLEESGGQIIGRSTINWQTSNTDLSDPIVSIRNKKGAGEWGNIEVDFNALGQSGTLPVVMGFDDDPLGYEMTVRNMFNDRITTGGAGLYNGDPNPPANPALAFKSPRVVSWSVAENTVYAGHDIHVAWQTKTATALELVLIRGGNEEVLYPARGTSLSLNQVISSNNVAVRIPSFEGEGGAAQLRLDVTGPAGIASSVVANITLKHVPQSGVLSFCARPSYPAGAACEASPMLNLEPGRFTNSTRLEWSLGQQYSAVRLCVGDAPDQNGNCDGRSIELNGALSKTIEDLGAEKQYWLVTRAVGEEINAVYDTPVRVRFNPPVIGEFRSSRNIINQNLRTIVSWRNVTNVTGVTITATAGDRVLYQAVNGDLVSLPLTINRDNLFMPAGSVTITTPNKANIRLRLTATGPGGSLTSNEVTITVNDVPSVAADVVTPAGDLDVYTPTRLYVEWAASENNLDEDQGVLVDADGIDKYAVCYDIYKTDATGAVLDAGGNKENDRLTNVGIHCPNLATEAFASLDQLPDGVILIDPTASANCNANSNCKVINNKKYYHAIIQMDPRLNDPTDPEKSEYLRYEIRVLTIDGGRNNEILGVQAAADSSRIVTDDSVEAWWKFSEDFTNPATPDCDGAPAGYKVCDSSRNGHHGQRIGNSSWLNPGILLNENDERTQWIEIDKFLAPYDELSVELKLSPYRINNYKVMGIGSLGDGTPFDWIATLYLKSSFYVYMRRNDTGETSSSHSNNAMIERENSHVIFTGPSGGNTNIVVNGISTTEYNSLSSMVFPESARKVFLGQSDGNLPPFSGKLYEVVIYKRVLEQREINNSLAAR